MADATVLNVMLACASACWHECASQLLQNITATHMTVSDRLRPRLITINRPVERGAVTGGPNLDNGGRGGASRQAKTPSNGLLRPFHSSLTPGICVFVSTRCTIEIQTIIQKRRLQATVHRGQENNTQPLQARAYRGARERGSGVGQYHLYCTNVRPTSG